MMIGIRPIHPSRRAALRQRNIIPLRPQVSEVHRPPIDVRILWEVARADKILRGLQSLGSQRGRVTFGGVSAKGNLRWVWTL